MYLCQSVLPTLHTPYIMVRIEYVITAGGGKNTVSGKNERARTVKRIWSEDEKAAVLKHLQTSILLKKLPGKAAIDKCIESEGALANRSWRNVKDFCRNLIDK